MGPPPVHHHHHLRDDDDPTIDHLPRRPARRSPFAVGPPPTSRFGNKADRRPGQATPPEATVTTTTTTTAAAAVVGS